MKYRVLCGALLSACIASAPHAWSQEPPERAAAVGQAIERARQSMDAASKTGQAYDRVQRRLMDHARREIEDATASYERGHYRMAESHARRALKMIADAWSRPGKADGR